MLVVARFLHALLSGVMNNNIETLAQWVFLRGVPPVYVCATWVLGTSTTGIHIELN